MTFKIRKYIYYIVVFIILSSASLWAVQHFFNLEVDFSRLSMPLISALCGMVVVYVLLDALRFYWILGIMDIHLPYSEIVKLVVIGTSVSNITPFLAGGSIAQIYLLNKQGVSIGRATAATSVRAVLASTFFFSVLPIVFYYNADILGDAFQKISHYLPWITLGYALWTTIIIVVSFHHQWLIGKFKHFAVKRRKAEKLLHLADEASVFLDGMRIFLKSGMRNITGALLTTSVHFVFVFLFSVVIVGFLGYQIAPYQTAAYQMMAHFVMYFGFTPGASGFAEGSFAYIFSKVVQPDDLALVVFLWRFSTVYVITAIGFVVMLIEVYRHRIRSSA
ncbi:flippase-like domain-containing protein [Fusibacter paucivorans]|uniref:Phosphatidylglycerol lysyltransferase n=1 Tax=Fusibacter paucivorans TaxID=76009 RepID=A0ABS5PPU3_9FIRM|nr:flippase-like domain-containing protein [Fusibacter paucivorans]